jgi:phage head maturation protease
VSGRGGSGLRVSGLLVPFGRWQEIDSPLEGHFVEMFAAGCLRESFAQRARGVVKGLWEHGRDRLLGRKAVLRVSRLWEEAEGAFYDGTLTDALPRGFVDRLRRGELGASIGAKVIDADYSPSPGRSRWNPKGLPERVYRRLDCTDVSLTARPAYREATAVLRSARIMFLG